MAGSPSKPLATWIKVLGAFAVLVAFLANSDDLGLPAFDVHLDGAVIITGCSSGTFALLLASRRCHALFCPAPSYRPALPCPVLSCPVLPVAPFPSTRPFVRASSGACARRAWPWWQWRRRLDVIGPEYLFSNSRRRSSGTGGFCFCFLALSLWQAQLGREFRIHLVHRKAEPQLPGPILKEIAYPNSPTSTEKHRHWPRSRAAPEQARVRRLRVGAQGC